MVTAWAATRGIDQIAGREFAAGIAGLGQRGCTQKAGGVEDAQRGGGENTGALPVA